VEGETAVRLAITATGPAFGTPATPATSMEKGCTSPDGVARARCAGAGSRVTDPGGPMAWNCAAEGGRGQAGSEPTIRIEDEVDGTDGVCKRRHRLQGRHLHRVPDSPGPDSPPLHPH